MRGHRLLLAMVGAAGFAAPAFAQEVVQLGTPVSSVVVVDTDALYRGTKMGQRIAADLEDRARALQAENEQITEALTAEEKSLTERRLTMDPVQFRKEAADFDTRVQGIRRARDAAIAAYEAERDSAPRAFIEEVRSIIGDLMIERGAVAVLDQRIVFLSLKDVDITRAVIARIDEVKGDGAEAVTAEPETEE